MNVIIYEKIKIHNLFKSFKCPSYINKEIVPSVFYIITVYNYSWIGLIFLFLAYHIFTFFLNSIKTSGTSLEGSKQYGHFSRFIGTNINNLNSTFFPVIQYQYNLQLGQYLGSFSSVITTYL